MSKQDSVVCLVLQGYAWLQACTGWVAVPNLHTSANVARHKRCYCSSHDHLLVASISVVWYTKGSRVGKNGASLSAFDRKDAASHLARSWRASNVKLQREQCAMLTFTRSLGRAGSVADNQIHLCRDIDVMHLWLLRPMCCICVPQSTFLVPSACSWLLTRCVLRSAGPQAARVSSYKADVTLRWWRGLQSTVVRVRWPR